MPVIAELEPRATSYQDQVAKTLPLIVVHGEGPPLHGRKLAQTLHAQMVLQERDALNKLLAE